MGKYPDLSDADSRIMEILWRDGEAGSTAIQKEVEETLGWSLQTVRTYLKRLMDKGLAGARETRRRVFSYFPTVSREDYAADKTGSVLSLYHGSLPHMVAGIVKNEDIPEHDLIELEALIRRLREERSPR
jgi:BlaI family penicillinase repressor